MTQQSETQERLKQIREIVFGPNFYCQGQFYKSRDDQKLLGNALLLLQETFSLIDTRAPVDSQGADRLPEWTECQSMFADGTATALSEFIRAYEPVQSTNHNDRAADDWRESLSAVINAAATQMRDACVEKVKAMRDEWRDKHANAGTLETWRHFGTLFNGADEIIVTLESLTLDTVK